MGPLGIPELLFILVLALLIFGPRKLPEIGKTLGRAMGEFKRATNDLKRSINTEIALDDERPEPGRPPASALPASPAVAAPAAGESVDAADDPDTSESAGVGAVTRDFAANGEGAAAAGSEPGEAGAETEPATADERSGDG